MAVKGIDVSQWQAKILFRSLQNRWKSDIISLRGRRNTIARLPRVERDSDYVLLRARRFLLATKVIFMQ